MPLKTDNSESTVYFDMDESLKIFNLDREESLKISRMWEEARQPENNIHIHDFVLESWRRSRKYNVDPKKKQNTALMDKRQLEQVKKANHKLIEVAAPAMHDLYKITQKTGFSIALADKQGILLEIVGSEKAKKFVAIGNFIEGSDWSEEVMGTNAVGTVLKIGRSIHIFGYEHYCKSACLCTCSASPIFDENREIIGVLNLTGPFNLMNPHTLGAVQSTAKAIERKFKLIDLYKQAEKSNVLRKAILESITGYLIVFDNNGRIIQHNEAARALLDIDDNIGFDFRKHIQKKNPSLMKLISRSKAVYGETVNFKTPVGLNKKFIINVTPLKTETNGEIEGHVISMTETHNVVRTIMKPKADITFEKLVGESSAFKYALNQAKLSATSDSNVLLMGESGVGKDLFAQ
ncbi:MAG: PAS domain-containing protein, partial [Proteobacteria bacterium]|nr:PAS domain-containing protein [Pseudomonadota bacterium]